MRWLRSDGYASKMLQAVRTAEVVGAALEAQAAVLRWSSAALETRTARVSCSTLCAALETQAAMLLCSTVK